MSIELSVSLNPGFNDVDDLENAISVIQFSIDKLKAQKELERKKRELKKEKNKARVEKPLEDDQIKCICGTVIKKDGLKRHEKSKTHQNFMLKSEIPDNDHENENPYTSTEELEE